MDSAGRRLSAYRVSSRSADALERSAAIDAAALS